MTKKYRLIAIDGTIIETFTSKCSAEYFRSYYHKMCGEFLDLQKVEEND